MCKRYNDVLPLTCPQLGTWPATQACALTGTRTSVLLVCRLVLLQACAQSTEPHQARAQAWDLIQATLAFPSPQPTVSDTYLSMLDSVFAVSGAVVCGHVSPPWLMRSLRALYVSVHLLSVLPPGFS